MEFTEAQWAWLAGFLEGEGCFTPYRSRRRTRAGRPTVYCMPRVQVQSCDRDVVVRVAAMLDGNVLGPYENNRCPASFGRRENSRPCWVASVAGVRANRVMRRILPHMGERRTGQIHHAWGLWSRRNP